MHILVHVLSKSCGLKNKKGIILIMNKCLKAYYAYRTNEREKIYINAFSLRTKQITPEKLKALKSKGMNIEIFKENLGSLFPLILQRVSEGMTIKLIAHEIGLSHRSLERFLQRHTRLDKAIRKARAIRSDSDTPIDILT